MQNNGYIQRVGKFRFFSRLAGIIVILIGLMAIVGWVFNISFLRDLYPEAVEMNPVTACCFVLSGLSLVIQVVLPDNKIFCNFARWCAFSVFTIAVIKLISLIGYDFGIDRLFFREKLEILVPPNRMAPNTAFGFLFTGASLVFLRIKSFFSQPFAFGVCLISMLAVSGYIYGVEEFYGIASYIPMALNSAIAFSLIGSGIFAANPESGLMGAIVSDNIGGRLARWLLPVTSFLIFSLAWLRLEGQIKGFYDTEFGIAFMVVLDIIILGFIIWLSAYLLNKLDNRRKHSEEQLVKINKELDTFAYSISHDLKAPLRLIDGFSRGLENNDAVKLDSEGKYSLENIRSNAQKMGQLIDDLLAFSRFSRKEMDFSNADMADMVKAVFKELKDTLMVNRVIRLDLKALPALRVDSSMMHQVWANLLSNAVKFTAAREEAVIEVGSFVLGEEIVFYVKDNGVGFDMQHADRLFGVFKRLPGAEEFEGTGIGLSIVERIIARHRGRVWAEAQAGKGAAFYFALPKL